MDTVTENMRHFGLKLWSTNRYYFKEAQKLYDKGVIQYIELYAVPGTYSSTISAWKSLKIPYIIHAAHSGNGVNLARKEFKDANAKGINEAKAFADKLDAKFLIVHGGMDGQTKEIISQLNPLKDERFLIENKPYLSLDKKKICNGNSPEEIKAIIKQAKVGFCLDVGHAICSANSHEIFPFDYIFEFLKLKPKLLHLTDGGFNSELDSHLHFKAGDYPIPAIYDMLPKALPITIESIKVSEKHLNDFAQDVEYLKGLK
jgi:deoxyribonuclease IV